VRTAALAAIENPAAVAAALIVSGALSRASLPALAAILPPARADGMAAALGQPDAGPVWLGAAIAVLAAFVLQPAGLAILLIALAAAAAAFWGVLAKRRVGGQTGDILGATEQTVSMAALLTIAAAQGTP
jgi:adenosylcobinamide-GDP ribazoletransferase